MRRRVSIKRSTKKTRAARHLGAFDDARATRAPPVAGSDSRKMSSSASVPGWVADYATVASALKANYAAVGPFEASDVVIGFSYLRDREREKRAASGSDEIHRADAEGVLGPGPSASELLDLRKLCVAVEASYLEDRASIAAAIAPLGHVVVVSKPESKFQQPAYFVSRDDAIGDVHLVIRGTASLKDALTDMDCDAEPLFADGPKTVFRAHRGMAAAARWIVAETREVVAMAIEKAANASKNEKARLTVLGHSLGAGTAALTAAILRETIPALRCVAFATPPCLESDAAESCSAFLTSVVLHDDVVSRASLANVRDLFARLRAIDWRASFAEDRPRLQSAARAVGVAADKMVGVTEKARRRAAMAAEKGAAFAAAAAERLFREDGKEKEKDGKGNGGKVSAAAGMATDAASGAATAAAAAAGSLASRFSASFGLGGAASKTSAELADATEEASSPPSLFVPGRVFHLRRDTSGAGASSARISRHVGTLARIELSSSLVADHSLSEYGEALETLALRAAKRSPRVEVFGALEWREVNPHVERLNRSAPVVAAALGGLAVSGPLAPLGAIAAGGAAMYAANQRSARDAAKEALERNASRWTLREKCFVLAHETCLKIESTEPGELRPMKFQLFFGKDAKRRFAVRLAETEVEAGGEDTGGSGESVIEIYEPDDEADGEAIRIRVRGGGAGVDVWLKALDRCCRGERGDPKPAALA